MRCGKDNFINEIEGIFNTKNLEEANNIIFSFSSTTIGSTEKDLGALLMETYILTLSEMELTPKTIILFGDAVLFAKPSSNVNRYFKTLQNKGCEILICSTSANYYQITNKISIGKLSTMKTILEKKLSATKLINL